MTNVLRKIYWDSMLLIYLLDGNPRYRARVAELLELSFRRGDLLYTSYVELGEVMAGAGKSSIPKTSARVRSLIDEMGFTYLPFDGGAVGTFSQLRSVHRVKTADAIHLACAAAAGIDLFLTGDVALTKLHVPGVHFIADFDTPLLSA